MKYDYFNKKLKKWTKHVKKYHKNRIKGWNKKVDRVFSNYFKWYDKIPFKYRPVIEFAVNNLNTQINIEHDKIN